MTKRWLDVMVIPISLWCRPYCLIIPVLNIRISFRASSDIVNRKRSGRYLETCRELDTSTTKNSGTIIFAYMVIGDKLESPDSPKHKGVCGTVIWSASENFKAAPRPPAGYTHVSFYFFAESQVQIFSQGDACSRSELRESRSVSWCLWLYGSPGWSPGSRRRSLG